MNYKIVWKKDEKYYSYTKNTASSSTYLKDWVVEYKINEWVKPRIKNSLLFYCTSMKDVKKYIQEYIDIYSDLDYVDDYVDKFFLFKCKVKNPLFIPSWTTDNNTYSELNYFWNNTFVNNKKVIFKHKIDLVKEYGIYKPLIFGVAEEIMLTELVMEI